MSRFKSQAAFLNREIQDVPYEELEPDANCPICLEKYTESSEDPVRIVLCQHIFGRDCLPQWEANKCPLCRAELWQNAPSPEWEQPPAGWLAVSPVVEEDEEYREEDEAVGSHPLDELGENEYEMTDAFEQGPGGTHYHDDDNYDNDVDEDSPDEEGYSSNDYESYHAHNEWLRRSRSPSMDLRDPSPRAVPNDVFNPFTFLPPLHLACQHSARTRFERNLVTRALLPAFNANHENTTAATWRYATRSLPAYNNPHRYPQNHPPVIPGQADLRAYALTPPFERPCPDDLLRCYAFWLHREHTIVEEWITVRADLFSQAFRDFARFCAPLGMWSWERTRTDRQARVLAQVENVGLPAWEAANVAFDGVVVKVRVLERAWERLIKSEVGKGKAYPEALWLMMALGGVVVTWRLCREVEVFGWLL
ncbi:Zinc finger RING-type protein [Macrophomina phaseolina MS6]|uniref:Zinc finger RING-type protein n=1 Tax=Macrophomina phaseolina (strain MS6) TaxID=1126212 RepID=K2R6E5_MACPH|nr:Zinc finger RING-type protein [Macrophomina phaseolina MS6]